MAGHGGCKTDKNAYRTEVGIREKGKRLRNLGIDGMIL
jgi:hypothetical protein